MEISQIDAFYRECGNLAQARLPLATNAHFELVV
jgi:hypothetical protein